MSEYYQHYLIPVPHEHRPDADSLLQFIGELFTTGYVGETHTIAFSSVAKRENSTREMTNPFTGETMAMKMPSRKGGKEQSVANIEQLRELINSAEEYDISVSGDTVPSNLPLVIGYVEDSSWMQMKETYHNEIRFRSRSHVVRLSHLRNEDDLHRPLDFSNPPPPIFDEDCDTDEGDGVFVHPHAGAIRIAGAGCGMFWIEFNFGKFVYPKPGSNRVDLLDESLVALAEKTLAIEFLQACNWG